MIKKIAAIVCFCLLAMNAEARNGIFVTAEGGIATQSGLPNAANVGALYSDRDIFPTAIRGSVGYNHDIWNWFGFGFDMGMGRFGKQNYYYNSGEIHIYAETLEFLMQTLFHVNQHWDVIAKAGGIRETLYVTGRDQETQIHPQAVIGAAYNINCHVALTGTYTRVFSSQEAQNFQDLNNKTPALNEYMLGLRYTF